MSLPFHPLANLFPLIEGAEFDALVEDVRNNGLRDRIVVHEGMILDGRNRYRAGLEAGLFRDADPIEGGSPIFIRHFAKFLPDLEGGPLEYVISKNLKRRHLNESQRAMVAARLANMRQGERTDVDESANLLKVSQPEAAKLLNVSPRLVGAAKRVLDGQAPEVTAAVEQGRLAASAAADLLDLPPQDRTRIVADTASGELLGRRVRAEVKKKRRADREQQLGEKIRALPDVKAGFILADPEWRFATRSWRGMDRSADNHYPTSDDATIMARDVERLAAPDCVLGLWVTDLARGIDTMRAWGFTFKSYFVWVKDIVAFEPNAAQRRALGDGRFLKVIGGAGTGYWNVDRDELFLIGTRGNPVCPAPGTQGESVWFAAAGAHSEKPQVCYDWIIGHFPNTPKVELNARRLRTGFIPWGNEAPELQDGNDVDLIDAHGMVCVSATQVVAAGFVTPDEWALAKQYASSGAKPANDAAVKEQGGLFGLPDYAIRELIGPDGAVTMLDGSKVAARAVTEQQWAVLDMLRDTLKAKSGPAAVAPPASPSLQLHQVSCPCCRPLQAIRAQGRTLLMPLPPAKRGGTDDDLEIPAFLARGRAVSGVAP